MECGQDRHRFAEVPVQAGLAAAHLGAVHTGQVVQDQGAGMGQLDRAGQFQRVAGIAAGHLAGEQGQQRPDILALGTQEVGRGAMQERIVAGDRFAQTAGDTSGMTPMIAEQPLPRRRGDDGMARIEGLGGMLHDDAWHRHDGHGLACAGRAGGCRTNIMHVISIACHGQ
jgi:hypothetical protein